VRQPLILKSIAMTVHATDRPRAPFIVGMGGTVRTNSSTERALRLALGAAEKLGCRTLLISGTDIDLPNYRPEVRERIPTAERLVAAIREADGVIIGSPGYHGGISGLVKNALDYLEDLSKDKRPYLDGRPVGCIATAAGWQGAVATLDALRNVVHALRGWPTPIGIAINTAEPVAEPTESGFSARSVDQVTLMVQQMVQFVGRREASSAA
jgi:FMN reductase